MIDEVTVSVVQMEPSPFRQKDENVRRIVDYILQCKAGADLVVFPELALTNFFEHGSPDSRRQYYEKAAMAVGDPAFTAIAQACERRKVHAIVGFAERSTHEGYLYNSAAVISPQGVIGVSRKNHLPLFEKLYFCPGDEQPVFDLPFAKVGINICYDAFFPESSRSLALKGAEIIVNISSVWRAAGVGGIPGMAQCKERYFDVIPVAQSIGNQVHFIQANAAGRCFVGTALGTWERMGKSKIVSALGKVLAEARGNEETVLDATLTRNDLLLARTGFSFWMDRLPWRYSILVRH